ncbi:alpha/beta hydrolase family protein [Xanthomonas citri]|uniref:S9 family peptidase n=1 Tax=Xanthomonas citri pv. durantae TaxID=487862 RepID=A0A9X6BJK4_XANCI|nr:S9 family peptidase [Xanthomonas citri]PWF13524.1 peptidase S9 [Xanthomonas citri pv. citri]QRD58038.1 S9 family peptidase [Xanthomonas citri pv. citri]UVG61040.1 S9 family peptidase [Xanthomonas citri pv. durantae]
MLVGYRARGTGLGTNIKVKKTEAVAAFLTDPLPDDDRSVIVAIWPMSGQDPYTRAEKLDVTTGRRLPLARAPIQRASFTTDHHGQVRFAQGAGSDNVSKLYYRKGTGDEWALINDEQVSGHVETPLGFSQDERIAYLRVQSADGPDAIVGWDIQANRREQVLRDAVADPLEIIYRNGTTIPVGAIFMADRPRTRFFDEHGGEARMYHSLEAAFAGNAVRVTSSTKDGRYVMLEAYSGSNPGDFYVFDTQQNKAQHVISRRDWFDPERTATVQPIALQARDGMPLHGYLTLPRSAGDKHLPMVVMPHGGPFEIFDSWQFDDDAQLLAQAGYAVLQINFRGSGNYGRHFQHVGARQWGGTMQDDVTDATRWAIAQGYADARKICIVGASYGAYAALMGAAKESGLYACAAGYVGVYDLPMMFTSGDIQKRGSGENYLKQWLGDPATLAARSPVNLARQIKVPVFLAAGGEDERAPIQHSKRMEAALRQAGTPVETLYFDTEGHGFYTEPHRRAFYAQLLAFLSKSLGGAKAD